eukprot:gene25812-biopygen8899
MFATGIELESKLPIARARFQLCSSGRKHPPRDISSSETGHCYGGIDVDLKRDSNGNPQHTSWQRRRREAPEIWPWVIWRESTKDRHLSGKTSHLWTLMLRLSCQIWSPFQRPTLRPAREHQDSSDNRRLDGVPELSVRSEELSWCSLADLRAREKLHIL